MSVFGPPNITIKVFCVPLSVREIGPTPAVMFHWPGLFILTGPVEKETANAAVGKAKAATKATVSVRFILMAHFLPPKVLGKAPNGWFRVANECKPGHAFLWPMPVVALTG